MTPLLSRAALPGGLLLAVGLFFATPTGRTAAQPAAPAAPARTAGKVEYNRDVRPILAENCFACHGPDSAARKAGLRLDRRDDAIEAKAIVPGDSKGSVVVERVFTADPMEMMPPPKSHKKLTAAQKETLKKWVEQG